MRLAMTGIRTLSRSAVASSSTWMRLSRSYASQATGATAAPSSQTSADVPDAGAPVSLPSAAPPGTVLSGVSILKDRADPIALEDSQYPPWLFKLLEDPSIAASSSVSAGKVLSKGEARIAARKQMKALRAERVANEKATAKAAERARRQKQTDPHSSAVSPESLTVDAVSASQAAEAVHSDILRAEKEKRKALRKANREAIKASNFIKSTK